MRFKVIVLAIVLLAFAGCGGGGARLAVGDISGPTAVNENFSAQYSITATGDTGIECQWAVEPASLGTLSSQTSLTTAFVAGNVSADTSGTIRVSVTSDNGGPVVESLGITVHDLGPSGWVRTWGAAGEDGGYGVALDRPTGSIYVCGRFGGTADFDPATSTDIHASNGDYDAFLSKFDSSGDFVWARTWGGTGAENAFRATVDDLGAIYVIGPFAGTVDFDPGTAVVEKSSSGHSDVYLSKIDPSGNLVWVRTWGGSEGNEEGFGLCVDRDGNICATGFYRGTVDFDPGPGVDEHSGYGQLDSFLVKFDPSGNFIWARTWGGPENDKCYSVASDSGNSLYVIGWFYNTVDFDPGPGEYEVTSHGWDDIYLTKFSETGDFVWARTWGGELSDGGGHMVVVDAFDNIYATGHWRATVDFDPGPGSAQFTSKGYDDAFVSSFDSSGNFRWARTSGGSNADISYGVNVDSSGNVYSTGEWDAEVGFDQLIGDWTSIGKGDLYVSKLSTSGNLEWSRLLTGSGEGRGHSIDFDSLGNVYLIGTFKGTVDFEPGDSSADRTSNGGGDVFLMKILPDGSW